MAESWAIHSRIFRGSVGARVSSIFGIRSAITARSPSISIFPAPLCSISPRDVICDSTALSTCHGALPSAHWARLPDFWRGATDPLLPCEAPSPGGSLGLFPGPFGPVVFEFIRLPPDLLLCQIEFPSVCNITVARHPARRKRCLLHRIKHRLGRRISLTRAHACITLWWFYGWFYGWFIGRSARLRSGALPDRARVLCPIGRSARLAILPASRAWKARDRGEIDRVVHGISAPRSIPLAGLDDDPGLDHRDDVAPNGRRVHFEIGCDVDLARPDARSVIAGGICHVKKDRFSEARSDSAPLHQRRDFVAHSPTPCVEQAVASLDFAW